MEDASAHNGWAKKQKKKKQPRMCYSGEGQQKQGPKIMTPSRVDFSEPTEDEVPGGGGQGPPELPEITSEEPFRGGEKNFNLTGLKMTTWD